MARTSICAGTVESARTTFSVSSKRQPANLASFDRFVTVVVDTGACGIQTYLTPDECDALAAALVKAAAEQRDIIAAPTQAEAA